MTTTKIEPAKYASPGAVNQHGGELRVVRCDTCGANVVWATSKRTNKRYLASVFTGQRGSLFYVGASIHTPDCDRRVAEQEALAAQERRIEQMGALTIEAQRLHAAGDTEGALAVIEKMSDID